MSVVAGRCVREETGEEGYKIGMYSGNRDMCIHFMFQTLLQLTTVHYS